MTINKEPNDKRWIADRPPTVDEVPDGERCDVTYKNGADGICSGVYARDNWRKAGAIIAWAPRIKPYVPSEPKRVEGWINLYQKGSVLGMSLCSTEEAAKDQAGSKAKTIHIVELKDGDPHPDDLADMRRNG